MDEKVHRITLFVRSNFTAEATADLVELRGFVFGGQIIDAEVYEVVPHF